MFVCLCVSVCVSVCLCVCECVFMWGLPVCVRILYKTPRGGIFLRVTGLITVQDVLVTGLRRWLEGGIVNWLAADAAKTSFRMRGQIDICLSYCYLAGRVFRNYLKEHRASNYRKIENNLITLSGSIRIDRNIERALALGGSLSIDKLFSS